MKEELRIVYQDYIPDELIEEFEKLEYGNKLGVDIKKEKTEPKYYNFIGSEISDIVIYIQQHTTELIVGGLLVPLAYGALTGGIRLLWTGLSKIVIKNTKSNTNKEKRISLRLIDKDRAIEVVLSGDIDNKQAEKIISDAFMFVSSEKSNEAFKNPDFIPKETINPMIRLNYNKEKNIWEPENFGENRRKMEEYQKWAEENSKS